MNTNINDAETASQTVGFFALQMRKTEEKSKGIREQKTMRQRSNKSEVVPPFAAGSRKASRGQSRTKSSWLAGITEEVLTDTPKLMALFLTAADLPADNFALQRQVIALAVHVTNSTGVRNPVGTFIAKIRKRDWSTINGGDEDEAAERHRAWLGIQAPRRRRRRKGEPRPDPVPIGDTLRQLIQQMSRRTGRQNP